MIAHYHGQLSDDRHLPAGEVVEVSDKAGKELVARGKAEEVKAKAAAPTATKSGHTK